MDKLDQIFEMQAQLNEDIRARRNLDFSKQEWIQKNALAMLVETGELMDEVNYKWWKNPKEPDDDAIREELVDVLHFFVSMCLNAGMSAEDLYAVYCAKNKENFDRQHGLSKKKGYDVTQ